MDSFWLEKAKKYICEHNAFEDVTEVNINTDGESATISAIVSIGLPSMFIKAGITDIGVKNKEEIRFIFTKQFPLKAPKVLLRDDFPRSFPHINASMHDVCPCIYEGDLSELLQQSEWLNGILNQLVDWLEKAASNDLLNYEQGWERMRNDSTTGLIIYDVYDVLKILKKNDYFIKETYYENRDGFFITDELCNFKKSKIAQTLVVKTLDTIDSYIPNSIKSLQQLYEYIISIGITDIKKIIENIDKDFIIEDVLFIVLAIKRPVNLINSELDIEFLNFVIHKSPIRKKKGKRLKRVLPDCKIGMLAHILDRSPELLKKMSGTKTKLGEANNIALIGCGSLGSKIGMHLARNGNSPFLCIDNDIFTPHNNARHALIFTSLIDKAELLAISMTYINRVLATFKNENAFHIDYNKSRIIIDTTASLAVRNFLMNDVNLSNIVSCGLFNHGISGILFVENKLRTTRLSELWAHLYFNSLESFELRNILFSQNIDNVQIGENCSSQTMIVDDARISIMASTMSLILQQILEEGFPSEGNIYLLQYDDHYSLSTKVLSVPKYLNPKSIVKKDWDVSVSSDVHNQMKKLMGEKAPKETGGVLLGTVFLFAKKVVITGLLTAPTDSIEEPYLFKLGTVGLEQQIKNIEQKTNGKVTYLGTWHSHPQGGSASQTDTKTLSRLLFVRNYEPTICIIISGDDIILV